MLLTLNLHKQDKHLKSSDAITEFQSNRQHNQYLRILLKQYDYHKITRKTPLCLLCRDILLIYSGKFHSGLDRKEKYVKRNETK